MREARERSSVAMLGRKALDAEALAVTAAAAAAGDAAARILEACDSHCIENPRMCMYAAGRMLAAPGRGREYVACALEKAVFIRVEGRSVTDCSLLHDIHEPVAAARACRRCWQPHGMKDVLLALAFEPHVSC